MILHKGPVSDRSILKGGCRTNSSSLRDSSLTCAPPRLCCSGTSGPSWHRRTGSDWTGIQVCRWPVNRYLAAAIILRRTPSWEPRWGRSRQGLLCACVRLSWAQRLWVRWVWKPVWSRAPVPAEHWTRLCGFDLPFLPPAARPAVSANSPANRFKCEETHSLTG